MDIQVSTNRGVDGLEQLSGDIDSVLWGKLSRCAEHITRLDVHLVDENADNVGEEDKRCTIEARVAGQQPVAVSHSAGTLEAAYSGATTKLSNLLNSQLGT